MMPFEKARAVRGEKGGVGGRSRHAKESRYVEDRSLYLHLHVKPSFLSSA